MRAFAIACLITLSLTLSHCKKAGFFCSKGKGTSNSKTFSLDAFSRVDLRLDADLTLIQGAEQQVTVTAQNNIMKHLELTVSDGELKIDRAKCFNSHNRILVEITVPDLQGLDMNSTGNITTMDTFFLSRLDILHTSSGHMQVSVNLDLLNVEHRGEGNMTMIGRTHYQDVIVNAKGRYQAFGLQSDTCFIVTSASSDAEILVDSFLDVKIRSSGNVLYKGNPNTIIEEFTGSGQLIDSN